MSEVISLDVVDADGAVREALDEAGGSTRAQFFRRAAVAGGTFAAGGVLFGGLPSVALGKPSASQDVAILNFALTLEYLEAAFYTEAEAKGALSGATAGFAKVVGGHERAHVAYLKNALGSAAVAKPRFDFHGTTADQAQFQATAIALEDTGVGAYNGQGPNLTKKTLAAAAMIVSVEARHAAWMRDIVRKDPAPQAFERALSKNQVLARVNATGFVVA